MKLLAFIFDLITAILGNPTFLHEDFANRNDRGRFKRDSEKYVTR